MRGTPEARTPGDSTLRLIPAYAGNTAGPSPPGRSRPAHPRVCGEHLAGSVGRVGQLGSSPRMRGTPSWWPFLKHGHRLIPAYAGNTAPVRARDRRRRAHPRVCGEHGEAAPPSPGSPGSSPRMRGTPVAAACASTALGLIPAYAGNTRIRLEGGVSSRAHPRVCGEHAAPSGFFSRSWGSSPRMRGTHRPRGRQVHDRLAHPRVCGEHTPMSDGEDLTPGSSPRMRGTLLGLLAPRDDDGLIPAYAGNTDILTGAGDPETAHPRVCGEHLVAIVAAIWGIRLIPAYAGNTRRGR